MCGAPCPFPPSTYRRTLPGSHSETLILQHFPLSPHHQILMQSLSPTHIGISSLSDSMSNTPEFLPHPTNVTSIDSVRSLCFPMRLARLIVARYGHRYESNSEYLQLRQQPTRDTCYLIRRLSRFIARQLAGEADLLVFSKTWLRGLVEDPTETEQALANLLPNPSWKRDRHEHEVSSSLSTAIRDAPSKRVRLAKRPTKVFDLFSAVRAFESHSSLRSPSEARTVAAAHVEAAFVDWYDRESVSKSRKLTSAEWYAVFRRQVLGEEEPVEVERVLIDVDVESADVDVESADVDEEDESADVGEGGDSADVEVEDELASVDVTQEGSSSSSSPATGVPLSPESSTAAQHESITTAAQAQKQRHELAPTASTSSLPSSIHQPPLPPLSSMPPLPPLPPLPAPNDPIPAYQLNTALCERESLAYHMRALVHSPEQLRECQTMSLVELDQVVRAKTDRLAIQRRFMMMVDGYVLSMGDEQRLQLETQRRQLHQDMHNFHHQQLEFEARRTALIAELEQRKQTYVEEGRRQVQRQAARANHVESSS